VREKAAVPCMEGMNTSGPLVHILKVYVVVLGGMMMMCFGGVL